MNWGWPLVGSLLACGTFAGAAVGLAIEGSWMAAVTCYCLAVVWGFTARFLSKW